MRMAFVCCLFNEQSHCIKRSPVVLAMLEKVLTADGLETHILMALTSFSLSFSHKFLKSVLFACRFDSLGMIVHMPVIGVELLFM